MSATRRFFDCFVPALEQAGRYALEIRGRIEARPEKDGDAWTSVVTDADLGVQHYLELISLADFPGWQFWGEERDASFHTKYFRDDVDYTLALDPINGTRIYRDGGDGFDIILSLIHRGRVTATLSYMPARRRYYGASLEGGAFVCDAGQDPRPLAATSGNMTIAVYKAEPWLDLLPDTVTVYDTVGEYAVDDPRCCMNNVFEGQLGGYLMGATPLLDVGATAFTVAQAGGRATNPDGSAFDHFDRFDPAHAAPLLVCSNPELHAIVSAAIAQRAS